MSRPKPRSKRPLKKLPELVAEKLAQRNTGDHRPVLIFAQDEARFGEEASPGSHGRPLVLDQDHPVKLSGNMFMSTLQYVLQRAR